MYPSPSNRRGRKSRRNCGETQTSVDQSFQALHEPPTEIINLAYESTSCPPAPNLPDCVVESALRPDGDVFSPGDDSRVGEEAGSSSRAAQALPKGYTGIQTRYVGPLNPSSRPNESIGQLKTTRHEISSGSEGPPLPPRAIGLALLEIYFSRVYNASLLFHKRIILQEYLRGKLPGFLVKAIFALATLYVISTYPEDFFANGIYSFLCSERFDENATFSDVSELEVLKRYGTCGLPWACSAAREAMTSAIEQPSLAITQALECLQLYWFGIGNLQSYSLCLGKPTFHALVYFDAMLLIGRISITGLIVLAYRSCQLLGYNQRMTDGHGDSGLSLRTEFDRRCFWACWISTCISLEPEPCIRAAWKEVAMIPLPAYIRDTGSHCDIILREKMDQDWQSKSLSLSIREHSPPAAAFLVKIIGVW